MTPKNSASFTVELFKVQTNKDGGGRIQLDFGADALDEVQKVQKANGNGGILFQLALVPITGTYLSTGSEDYEPDFNGEIQL